MEGIIVRFVDLPYKVGGVTAVDENGDFNVYVNSRWGYKGQINALEHEGKHIKHGDFDSKDTVKDIEGNMK